MTADASPEGRGPDETGDGPVPAPARAAVVLVSAQWAGPARPAPTVLQELGRRWGSAVHILLVDDPSEELLDLWQVDHLPTWLRLLPRAAAGESDGQEPELVLPDLSGTDAEGTEVTLPGPWTLVGRLVGAQPKHVVDAEFGPTA